MTVTIPAGTILYAVYSQDFGPSVDIGTLFEAECGEDMLAYPESSGKTFPVSLMTENWRENVECYIYTLKVVEDITVDGEFETYKPAIFFNETCDIYSATNEVCPSSFGDETPDLKYRDQFLRYCDKIAAIDGVNFVTNEFYTCYNISPSYASCLTVIGQRKYSTINVVPHLLEKLNKCADKNNDVDAICEAVFNEIAI